MHTLAELVLPSPCDWGQLVEHVRTSSYGNAYAVEGDVLRRVLAPGGEEQVVEFRVAGNTLLVLGQQAAPEGAVRRLATRLFSLDHDLQGFYTWAAGDPIWAELVQRFHGLRLLQAPDLYESLAITILGQQVNVAFASTLRRRMIEAFGPAVSCNGQIWRGFPSAQRIARCEPEELTALKMTHSKAAYLVGLARTVATGEISEWSLAALDDQAALARLIALKGVGRWTAEVVLMRGCGRLDMLPAADVGLMNAYRHLWQTPVRPIEPELRQLAAGWAPWRSYCTLYLWASLHD